MKIAVIPTTEGAGGTFVSTNLAFVTNATYLDLSKNQIGHTFFEVQESSTHPLFATNRILANDLCTDCNKCLSACSKKKFAINESGALLNCEGCPDGKCTLDCDKGALTANDFQVAELTVEKSAKTTLARPKYSNHPLKLVAECAIEHLASDHVIMDCLPADGAYTLDCLKLCDYCIIVVEPGVFDFENFKSLVRLCKLAGKPFGVIINKFVTQYDKLFDYCNLHSTEVLAKIPLSARETKLITAGKLIAKEKFSYKQYFVNAFNVIKKKVK